MEIRDTARPFWGVAATIIVLLLAPTPALAQRADIGWHPAPFGTPSVVGPPVGEVESLWAATVRDSVQIPRTHWLEGAALLGAASGAAGAFLGVGLCHYSDTCRHPTAAALRGFLILGLLGFGVGALIGGLFPKS